MRFRKASESGAMDLITNLEDNVRMNYSTDWLPPYVELRTELLNEYYLHERRRAEEGRKQKGGHPVLPILQGHDQPGPEQRACYGCGQKGDHFRGDPKCPAGPNAMVPLKFGRKESENGAKGQEKGQAKGRAKESRPKETWEGVVLPRIAQRKLLAQTGQGVMASASMAPIVDIPTTVLKQGIKGRMRLFFSLPRRKRRRESNYHHC